jgi:hypothetical protein
MNTWRPSELKIAPSGGKPVSGLLKDVVFDPKSDTVSFGVSDGEAVLIKFDESGKPIDASVTRNGTSLSVVEYASKRASISRQTLFAAGATFSVGAL